MTSAKGSLTVVGTGITLSGQITNITESIIRQADIVLTVVTEPTYLYLKTLNENTQSLRYLYQSNRPRLQTYVAMTEQIISHVLTGKRVVAAFYGHPGVFVTPSHAAIRKLRALGYEATQFLCRRYKIDPYMTQIIWQIGSLADFTHSDKVTSTLALTLLRDKLLMNFPANHSAFIYEAATLPIAEPRIEEIHVAELAQASLKRISTLVIPGIGLPELDQEVITQLQLTDIIDAER